MLILPESSFSEKDLTVLVDNKLTMCQQCVLAAKEVGCILDCIGMRVASKLRRWSFLQRRGLFPLYSSLLGKIWRSESSLVLPTI